MTILKMPNKFLKLTGGGALLVLFALLLAWVSFDRSTVSSWPGFFMLELLMAAAGWLAFYHLRKEKPPKWLFGLVFGAVVLRLVLGVFWFEALPVWGYPNETQQAGYIMYDPFLRDGHAWNLAQSGEPLIEAFRGYSPHDQYGGLLFISAFVYRAAGFGEHIPQFISAFSGLGVLYVWGLTNRLWGLTAAKWAAVGLALYPEAVLLGSAHMREAFTITSGAVLGFLLVRFWQDRNPRDVVVFFILVGITGAITWVYILQLALVLLLLIVGLVWDRISEIKLSRMQALGSGLGALIAAAVGVYFWRILERMSGFQGYLTHSYSGMVQAIFSRTPEILHTPFLLGYGIVRPLLPAAVIGKGDSFFWRVIGVWRALGWSVLLALLIYALYQIIKKRVWFRPVGMLFWGNMMVMLVAAYRAGGDMWDNPRYRAGFAAFQLVLATWGLKQQRKQQDPWLRRIIVLVLIQIFWLMMWYLPRYVAVPWQVGKALDMVGLGFVVSGLYLLWEWVQGQAGRSDDTAESNEIHS
jgi:hypothetical protein